MKTVTAIPDSAGNFQALHPLLTVQQVMKHLHLGRSKVYDLITREELPSIRLGRAIRVSLYDVETLLNSCENVGEQLPAKFAHPCSTTEEDTSAHSCFQIKRTDTT